MNRISKKTLNRPIRDETVKQLFLDDSSSSIKDEEDSGISDIYKHASNDTKSKDTIKLKKQEESQDFKKDVFKRRTKK